MPTYATLVVHTHLCCPCSGCLLFLLSTRSLLCISASLGLCGGSALLFLCSLTILRLPASLLYQAKPSESVRRGEARRGKSNTSRAKQDHAHYLFSCRSLIISCTALFAVTFILLASTTATTTASGSPD